jgi:hypothetical protein
MESKRNKKGRESYKAISKALQKQFGVRKWGSKLSNKHFLEDCD